jgi:hypothetical protein
MTTHNKEAAEREPMDEWIDYAKRSGLLDEHGVATDRHKAQTAWFAFTYAWNRRSALTASEAAGNVKPSFTIPAQEAQEPGERIAELDEHIKELENAFPAGRDYDNETVLGLMLELRSALAAPAQAGMTDDEIRDKWIELVGFDPKPVDWPDILDFVRAIEARGKK